MVTGLHSSGPAATGVRALTRLAFATIRPWTKWRNELFVNGFAGSRESRPHHVKWNRGTVAGELRHERMSVDESSQLPRRTLLFLAVASIAVAQIDTTVVTDRVRCATCRIVVDSGPTIRSVPGKADLTMATRFVRTRSNGFIASELLGRSRLAEFDSAGAFVGGIEIGVSPDAPAGRMSQVVAVSRDGTISVADEFFARVAITGALLGSRARLFPDPPPQVNDLLALGDDVTIVQAMIPVRGGAHAFHIVDGTGSIVRGFGAGTNVVYLEGFGATRRRLAQATSESFWSVPPNTYELTHWDTTGTIRQHLMVASAWFRAWDERLPAPDLRTQRWPSVIQGITVDSLGLLWVVSWVPNNSWVPPRSRRELDDAKARTRLTRSEYEQRLKSVVEVIDTRCGVIVARQVLPVVLFGFVAGSGGEVTSVLHDFSETTGSTFTFLRLSLERSAQEQTRRVKCAP